MFVISFFFGGQTVIDGFIGDDPQKSSSSSTERTCFE